MNKKLIVVSFILSTTFVLFAQEEKEQKFGIKFSGYVKNDFFFDTRQTVAAREGHFLLWPVAESLDATGKDINAGLNYNFLAVQSKLSVSITGPDAFGAKTSGKIEGDFFAQANDNINLFRLRHAFIKLNWINTELLTGQYWNPLFVIGCFPGTISFNTGIPFQSFARNPQLRVTQSIGDFKVVGALLGQRDHVSYGFDKTGAIKGSSDYLRNSGFPDMHLQVHYLTSDLIAGLAFEYKTLRPRLFSTVAGVNYKVDESVSSMSLVGFATLKLDPVTIKIQGRYGENNSDVIAPSGYVVQTVSSIITGEQTYTPLKNITVWTDIGTTGDKVQIGVFAAYLKGLGTKDPMSALTNTVVQTLNVANPETMFRISPRVMFISNKTRFGAEIEYTSADFPTSYDINYVSTASTQVANTRLLLSAIYSF